MFKYNWVVVSNIFDFHPYLGKIPILTNIFQMGWTHQLDNNPIFDGCVLVAHVLIQTVASVGKQKKTNDLLPMKIVYQGWRWKSFAPLCHGFALLEQWKWHHLWMVYNSSYGWYPNMDGL